MYIYCNNIMVMVVVISSWLCSDCDSREEARRYTIVHTQRKRPARITCMLMNITTQKLIIIQKMTVNNFAELKIYERTITKTVYFIDETFPFFNSVK